MLGLLISSSDGTNDDCLLSTTLCMDECLKLEVILLEESLETERGKPVNQKQFNSILKEIPLIILYQNSKCVANRDSLLTSIYSVGDKIYDGVNANHCKKRHHSTFPTTTCSHFSHALTKRICLADIWRKEKGFQLINLCQTLYRAI